MAVSGDRGAALAGEEIEVRSLIGLQNMLVVEPIITAIKDRLWRLPGCTAVL